MEQGKETKENLKSWLIALGGFILNFIVICPAKLSGLIYVVLIESYGTDRRLAAMPLFMSVLMTSLLGPVTGLIGQKLGSEKTTLLGVLLSVFGFGGLFFAENIIVVILLFGLFYGSGMILGCALIPNILRRYFDKNTNSANGINRSGSCIAAFVASPLAIYLFDVYGAAGTFLIIAGLMLNGIPVIMLIIIAGKEVKPSKKPLEKPIRKINETDISQEDKVTNKCKDVIAASNKTKSNGVLETTYVFETKESTTVLNSDDEQSSENVFKKCNIENYKDNSNVALSKSAAPPISAESTDLDEHKAQEYDNEPQINYTESKDNHIGHDKNCNALKEIASVSSEKCNIVSSNDTFTNSTANHNNDVDPFDEDTSIPSSKHGSNENSANDFNFSMANVIDLTAPNAYYNLNNKKIGNPIERNDIEVSSESNVHGRGNEQSMNIDLPSAGESSAKNATNSLQSNAIVISQQDNDQRSAKKQLNNIDLPLSGGSPTENPTKVLSVAIEKPSTTKKTTFCSTLRILTNPIFIVIMGHTSFLAYNLTIVQTTIIDYSRDKGIPTKYEVYILMFQPLFDFFGRIGLTWVVDKGYIGYIVFQMVACLISAASVLGLILCSDFEMLMVYSAFFALSSGAQLAIAPGMVFKFLEKEEYMMAQPCKNMLYAPLSFTAIPIIGYFRNERKSYDGVYYIVIAVSLLCCAITPLLDTFSKARKKRKEKALEMNIAD